MSLKKIDHEDNSMNKGLKKVFVWGKFDGLHNGHFEFLENAKKQGDELYVIVIPGIHIIKDGGKMYFSDEERKNKLSDTRLVKKVLITSLREGDDFSEVLRIKPDIFVLGHDQNTIWEEKLKKYLSDNGIYPDYIRLGIYNNGLHNKDLRKFRNE